MLTLKIRVQGRQAACWAESGEGEGGGLFGWVVGFMECDVWFAACSVVLCGWRLRVGWVIGWLGGRMDGCYVRLI